MPITALKEIPSNTWFSIWEAMRPAFMLCGRTMYLCAFGTAEGQRLSPERVQSTVLVTW